MQLLSAYSYYKNTLQICHFGFQKKIKDILLQHIQLIRELAKKIFQKCCRCKIGLFGIKYTWFGFKTITKFTERRGTRKELECSYREFPTIILLLLILPHTYFHSSGQILQFPKLSAGALTAMSTTGFFFVWVLILFYSGGLLVLFFWRSPPHFSSDALTDLGLTLGEQQLRFPTWAGRREISLYKTLRSSAQHIKARAGTHHDFHAAELTIKISENKCNVCRNFRPCQKMAYHCASKPYLYTAVTEISAIKCTYKNLVFTISLANLSRIFSTIHAYI